MNTLLMASAAALFVSVAAVPAASAAPLAGGSTPYVYVAHHFYPAPWTFPRGVSYGTGYHGAGTLTGGPSGGLPDRN